MDTPTVTAAEFATFAAALDPEGPGVLLSDLSIVALDVLAAAAKTEVEAATIAAAIAEKTADPPVFFAQGPFADEA
jgi:hypothetical protein